MAEETLTAAVAGFAAGFDGGAIPAGIRRKAGDHVIDSIGCGLAGGRNEVMRGILAATAQEARPGPCRVLGAHAGFGPATAAFVNAVAINALDFDDGLEDETGKGMGHPGASIVAAALSAAFEAPVSGRDFLTAVTLAYEVNNRLIHAIQPSIERFREVYGVCQHQAIGAAVAYGRLVGLDAGGLENALGFAGTLANVPSLHKYNWQKRPLITFKDFVAPAAEAGVRGVTLHRSGLVGAKAVLDGPSGLWRMLGSDRFAPERLTEGLGESWTLPFNTIKPYPTCRWMHAVLGAFETLLRENAVAPEAIEEVTILTDAALLRDFMDAAPVSFNDAQFSFPYAVGAMAFGIGRAHWFDEAWRDSPEQKAFAGRVRGEVDAEASRLMSTQRRPAGRVALRLKDGRRLLSPLALHSPGGVAAPLPASFVADKFRGNAGAVMEAPAAEELLALLDDLDTVTDVAASLRRFGL